VACLTHDRNASGRSSLQLEQVRSASPAVHISLGEFRVATCVTGKASANDTKDEPSAMVKTALLTSSSPTAPLPAPDGDSPLISDPRPALELGVVQWHTVAATSQAEHPGCDGFMLDMASQTGVPRSGGDGDSRRSLDRRGPSTMNSRPYRMDWASAESSHECWLCACRLAGLGGGPQVS
jgi:hypothetical protein